MAFSIGQVQFLDSFQFTMKSLDNLVGTLNEDDLTYTRQLFPDNEKFYSVTRKGVFRMISSIILENFSTHHFPQEKHFLTHYLTKNVPRKTT